MINHSLLLAIIMSCSVIAMENISDEELAVQQLVAIHLRGFHKQLHPSVVQKHKKILAKLREGRQGPAVQERRKINDSWREELEKKFAKLRERQKQIFNQ